MAVLLIVGATLGAVIVALTLNAEIGQAVFSPGPLSFQHSTYKSQCADCHVNAQPNAVPLVWFFGHTSSELQRSNSLACLKCHNLGPQPFAAHALPSARLDEISRRSAQGKRPLRFQLSGVIGGNPHERQSAWECGTCHVEHRGKETDLIRVSDLQCQGCHAVQFESFSQGHPPFVNYPFRRRTRIEFDHRAHFEAHFKDTMFADRAPASCSGCHAPDPTGGAMLVQSFEQTCATCHLDQMRGKGQVGAPGITVIRVPGLDAETLKSRGIAIGDWPEDADGTITPFMQLLLGTNTVAGSDLLDLSKANDERLRQAADFAWAIKELIYDLSDKGHAELERRLARSLHGGLSARPAEALAGLLSADVIRALQAKWFPNLAAEVAQHRAGRTITTAGQTNAGPALAVAANLKPEEWVLRGGWYRSDLEFSLSYRPVGHPDPFLQSWLELTGAVPEGQTVFDFLSAPHAPGLCIKCHSVDGPQPLRVNWRGFRPDAFDHPFTRFSHTAHFSLLDDRGCQTCHQLDRELSADTYAASFARSQRDPSVFHSSFKSIELASCSSCHTKRYASESCLECHNYHVGHFIPTLPRQQWPRADSKLNP